MPLITDRGMPTTPIAPLPPEKLSDAVPPDKREDPLSSKFAILARKEKAITQKLLDLKAREEAWKAREAEIQSSHIAKSRFSEDPLGVLKENGIEYDRLTELMLNQPNQGDPAIRELREEIKALREEQKQTSGKFQDSQTQAYDQAVKQIKSEVTLLVDNDSAYETIKETNSQEGVVELIEETFKVQGILLSVEEAAKIVEDHLVDEAMKMANLKKVKAKLSPLESAMKLDPEKEKSLSRNGNQFKTLTNDLNRNATPTRFTERERRERAIAAFQGRLNE